MTKVKVPGILDSPITGGVTWEEYIEHFDAFDEHPFMQSINHDVVTVFKGHLHKIAYVPGFVENFHHSEFDLQYYILRMISCGKCVWSTALHLRLIHENRLNFRKVQLWTQDQNVEMIFCDGEDGRPTERFGPYIRQLFYCLSVNRGGSAKPVIPRVDMQTLTMLAMKYGEEQVIETIDYWCDSSISNNFYNFTRIVEEWDTVKGFPVEWAVNVVRNAHRCR